MEIEDPTPATGSPVPPAGGKIGPGPDSGDFDPNDYFSTDNLQSDLRGRTIRGGMITISAQAIKFVVNIISTVALARLLSAGEFGLVAMVQPITSFIGLFKDLGLSIATVQRKDVTHEQVSTLFWINVAVSLVLACITMAISPLVGLFYHDTRTTWIALASGALFLLGGFTAQHQALLGRHLRFRALAIIDVSSMACGVGAAILAAWYGWSYWSLVVLSGTTGLTNLVLVWILSPWRPGRPVRGAGVRSMLRFGSGMTLHSFVQYFQGSVDKVALGKLWGAVELGFYTRGYNLFLGPLQQLYAPINAVLYPILCRIATDTARLRSVVLQALEVVMIVTVPIFVIIMASTDLLVEVLMGKNWGPAVPIARIFGIWFFTLPYGLLLRDMIIAMGRSDIVVRLSLINVISVIIGVCAGLHWGGLGVCVGITVVISGPGNIVWSWLVFKVSGIKLSQIWAVTRFSLVSVILCLGAAFCMRAIAPHAAPILGIALVALVTFAVHAALLQASGRLRWLLSMVTKAR